ncbi:MAG: hypothetical protein IT446_10045 [Phycisphaerales bacterium]|nr:hypothetical protein [Phycisphaerales bacterium]
MNYNRVGGRMLGIVLGVLALSGMAWAAKPKLTLYLPFNDSLDAQIAAGNPKATFEGKSDQIHFTNGINGKGWLTGQLHQAISFEAKGNLSPDQWTITFWVKGLEGADWHTPHLQESTHQEFWQLYGDDGESTRFYKYNSTAAIWLLYLPRQGSGVKDRMILAPNVPEQQWHHWAVAWRKGAGATLYLDGHLVGQDASFPVADPIRSIAIGQQFGLDKEDKIIDEFKIYDAALDPAEIAERYYEEGNFAFQPVLTVGPARHKPTIDGKIDPAEWEGTAGFTGLIDDKTWSIQPPPTWGRMAYDDRNLYLAFHSDQPAEVKQSPQTTVLHGFLRSQVTQHDASVSDDDCYYFSAMPQFPGGTLHHFYVNGIDTTYDYSLPGAGGVDLAWESHAMVKSIVDLNGWSLEMSIPLSSLGIDRISTGMEWRMDMGRIWKLLRQRKDAWAPGERVDDQPPVRGSNLGTVKFVDAASPVVDLRSFTITSGGEAMAVLGIRGNGPLTATLSSGDKTLDSRQISGPGEVKLQASVRNEAGQMVDLTLKNGDTVILRQSAPYIPQEVGQLTLWKYPSIGKLRVGWVIQSADPSALSLDAELKDAADKVVAQSRTDHLPGPRDSILMDVQSLPPGKYTLAVKIAGAQGIVQQQSFPYEKMPQPEWLGNTLGISNVPPPPWTDVKTDQHADTIGICDRSYQYDGLLLPRQIINRGKSMLAGPMRLSVKAGEKSWDSSAGKADVKWTESSATKAGSQRRQSLGPVRLSVDSYTEFDGMNWMKVSADPTQSGTTIQSLTFEIPMEGRWAELINTYDYSVRTTGALPKNGWSEPVSPVWLGNGDGGIQFFYESTATWIGSKRLDVQRREDGSVVMIVHLVDQPVTLNQPLQVAFGWIVSPTKPAPKHYRDWRVMSGTGGLVTGTGERGGPYLAQAVKVHPEIQPFSMWWQGWWWLPSSDYRGDWDSSGVLPVPNGSDNCDAIHPTKYGGNPVLGAPYGRMSVIGSANPWFAQFGDEWLADVNEIHRPDPSIPLTDQSATVSQASRSLRDFFAWGYDQLLATGKVKALYFDVSMPVHDNNVYHGAGVQRPGEPPAAQYDILGMRKSFQRIYTMMKAKHPDGLIFYHMSGEVMLPIDSFCDGMIDGENFTGMLNRKNNRGYENVLRMDQFRAEYSAQNNFGPASIFLPEFSRSGAIMDDEWETLGYAHAEYLLGLVLMHDSNFWWAIFPINVLHDAYLALDKAGLNSQWTFVPYWNQTYFKLPEGVNASLYLSPDKSRAIVVVMNVSGNDQSVDLPLTNGDIKTFGFTQATAIYPNQPVKVDGGAIHDLLVKQHNFLAILVK